MSPWFWVLLRARNIWKWNLRIFWPWKLMTMWNLYWGRIWNYTPWLFSAPMNWQERTFPGERTICICFSVFIVTIWIPIPGWTEIGWLIIKERCIQTVWTGKIPQCPGRSGETISVISVFIIRLSTNWRMSVLHRKKKISSNRKPVFWEPGICLKCCNIFLPITAMNWGYPLIPILKQSEVIINSGKRRLRYIGFCSMSWLRSLIVRQNPGRLIIFFTIRIWPMLCWLRSTFLKAVRELARKRIMFRQLRMHRRLWKIIRCRG